MAISTTEDLVSFIKDRNLIAHNYYRLTEAQIKGGQRLEDPEMFLMEFTQKCTHWEKVLRGLIATMKCNSVAEKPRQLSDIQPVDAACTARHGSTHIEAVNVHVWYG